jgi:hypothetical protein
MVATEPAYANRWDIAGWTGEVPARSHKPNHEGSIPSPANGGTMKEYEVAIKIDDNDYIDTLVISLVRQGYEVYYNDDENVVGFKAYDEEVKEINRNGKN